MIDRPRVLAGATIALLAGAALLTGCTKSEDSASPSTSSSAGGQVVATNSPAGPGCTLQQYGAPPLDLKAASENQPVV